MAKTIPQEDMSIENYLLQSDPFRSTSTSKPQPYPLITRPALETPWNESAGRITPIIDQLVKNHIPEYRGGGGGLFYLSKPNYPGGGKPRITWYVPVYGNAAGRSSFDPIKDEIRELLAVNNFPRVDVEVVDLERCFGPSTFAIAPDHPAVAVYNQIRTDLAGILQRKLRSHWHGMSLFHLGRSLETSSPTIVVLVSPETVYDWAELEAMFIERISAEVQSDIEIHVEFLPGAKPSICVGRFT